MDSRDAYLNCFEYAYAYETIAQSYLLIHSYDLGLRLQFLFLLCQNIPLMNVQNLITANFQQANQNNHFD